MAIIANKSSRKLEIDLSGAGGNAYALLNQARIFSEELDMNTDSILEDMQSDDYEHLIHVFDKHFGHVCDLIR